MKKFFGIALALALAAIPTARAVAMTNDEAGEKAMGLIEGVAGIVDADKADCDKMATDVNKYENDNAALIKELNEMKAKRSDAERKAYMEKYKTRMQAAMQKMMAGGQACEKNEKVKAAFMKMKG